MNKTISILVILILILAGAYLYLQGEMPSTQTEADVRELVADFGLELKNVSLLASAEEVANAMERQYGKYVTQDLIMTWGSDPQNAPGRLTSSPWPDRIDIRTITTEGSIYRVEGDIVEVTNEGGGIGETPTESARRPITLMVGQTTEGLRITSVTLGAYSGDGVWTLSQPNSQGVQFMYPAQLPTTYISAQEWPPLVERTVNAYSCTEGPITDADGPLKTQERRLVDDREYCVTSSSEGAAGSVFRAYEYAYLFGTSTYRVVFQLRYPQCANYDEPQKSACTAEQSSFDLDGLVDRIAQSVRTD
jgi:hypothetical protein